MEKIYNPNKLIKELPEIIKKIAEANNVQEYVKNPDFLEERLKSWHQFGLLTHTKKVYEAFKEDFYDYTKEKGIEKKVEEEFNEKIGNYTKIEIFESAIVLHDLGKILCLNNKERNREHEKISSEIIGICPLKDILSHYSFSDKERDYLKRCIATHDVLGKELRDELKEENKLTMEYIESNEVNPMYENIASRYKDIKMEIGIFYFCDSLGKSDIYIPEAEKESQEILLEKIKEKEVSPKLINAIRQLPINIKLGKSYLKSINI